MKKWIITLDIDSKNKRVLQKSLNELQYQFGAVGFRDRLEIRQSRKKGFHVKFLGIVPDEFGKEEEHIIRVLCGDDPKRIEKDKGRKGAPTNILFTDYKKVVWVGKDIQKMYGQL